MAEPAFTTVSDGIAWTRKGRTLHARAQEVTFTAKRSWLTGRWIVTGVSPLALPTRVTLYISRTGRAHGYWRNAPAASGYFGFCDPPALMPVLVGPKTLEAIASHDKLNNEEDVALHICDGTVETMTKVDDDNDRVVAEQLAIHRALGADHEALLDTWLKAAEQLRGTVATAWPPTITIPREFGSTTIALRWPASTQAGEQATIEFTVDARGAKLWSLEREAHPSPSSRIIANRHFLVMGEVPSAIADQLARLIARTLVVSIHVRRHVVVRIVANAPDVDVIEDVLELLAGVCGGAPEPYR
jgi:hypothetical protein